MIRDSIHGKAWKVGCNVSTDSIAPGRLISLRANPTEYAKHVLEDCRPDFAPNVRKDDFIVADRNFGCGSSREIAPIIIKLAGVGAVLGSAVQCWCGLVQFSDQCRCGFRASVGAVLVWCGAVFILNGMIFSFLDEKRVFKGVV